MICPTCGNAAPEGSAYCPVCGSPETPHGTSGVASEPSNWTPQVPPATGPSPSTTPQPAMPNVGGACPGCGVRLQGAAFYCPACGSSVAAGAPFPVAPGSQGIKVCRRCRRVGPATLITCPHCGGAMQSRGGAAAVVAVVAVVGLCMLIGIAVLAAILVPNFIRARAQGQYTACTSNLKNIATALEMWSTDHEGRYPTSLSQLVEGDSYLRTIPMCPAAEADTYSRTYRSSAHPDRFTVECSGHNHGALGAGPGYPQYSSTHGLQDR